MPAKVYLKPPEINRKSRHHRAYAGNGAIVENNDHPEAGKIYVMEFFNGVAQNVPEAELQRFKDVGVAQEGRPDITLP